MADFPSFPFAGRRKYGTNFVIINGRRVPVGGQVRGDELGRMLNAGPGRRPVKVADGGSELLDASRYYSAADLTDRRGNPVKISSIPDRTKGADMQTLEGRMERVLVFLDFANVDAGSRPFARVNYARLLEYLAQGRFLVEAYAYVPVDPRCPDGRRGLIRHLQSSGWMVYPKVGKIAGAGYKSNTDVEMTIDMIRSAEQIRPDIIVLCSGDGDFIPVVRELRRRGIRTEVASFEAQADATLPYEASGFISLNVWQDELAQSGNDALFFETPAEEDDGPSDALPDAPSVSEADAGAPREHGVSPECQAFAPKPAMPAMPPLP